MCHVWHKKNSDLDLWKGWTYKRKVYFFLEEARDACLLVRFIKKKNHALNNGSEQQMCQKDKLEFKIFQFLRANINDLSLVQKPFFPLFSFLFHNSMKFKFRWELIQILTLDAKITTSTFPNPSNSHYTPSCDSFHLTIGHMFVAAFCWSAAHINLACSRRSDCQESFQRDVSRKNLRGMG